MAVSVGLKKSIQIGGFSFTENTNLTGKATVVRKPSIVKGQAGTLTTRTSNTVGTLTLGSGHGITTGARIDLYFTGGQRRGITVGTVSGTSVPFTAGSGDNLPSAAAAVVACIAQSEGFVITGNDVVGIGIYVPTRGQITFTDASDAEIATKNFAQAGVYIWYATGYETNPLASGAVAKAFCSTENVVANQVFQFGVLIN